MQELILSCPNCNAAMETPFCGQCGQKKPTGLSFRQVSRDAWLHIANMESAFIRTVIFGFKSPGRAAREYIAGRRKAWYNPVKYTFLCTTLMIFIGTLLDNIYPAMFEKSPESVFFFKLILGITVYLIYLKLVPVAWLQRLFFGKQYEPAENYVFFLFTYGQITWFHIMFSVLDLYQMKYGFQSLMLLDFTYITLAVAGFYQRRHWKIYLKGFVLALCYYGIHLLVNFTTIMIISRFMKPES